MVWIDRFSLFLLVFLALFSLSYCLTLPFNPHHYSCHPLRPAVKGTRTKGGTVLAGGMLQK